MYTIKRPAMDPTKFHTRSTWGTDGGEGGGGGGWSD